MAALILAALAAGALSWGLAGVLSLSGSAPLKAVGLLLALAILAGPALSSHHRDRLGPANAVTLVRGVLVGLIAMFIGENAAPWLILIAPLAALALAMDGLDGFVARRTGWASDFGARLDMELDALLTMVLCVLVWQTGRAGVWVLASGLMRYAFVAVAVFAPWLSAPLPPRYRRKVVCVIQIGSLVLCLLPGLSPALTAPLAAAGLIALTGSFAVDIALLWRQR
ncbi:MAG: phosphatidylglycerophosphate synthase [Myxococcota bacterium]